MTSIRSAMVLAAGLGTRMKPLTLTMPKPMVPVCGQPLIDHVLDRLEDAGAETVVVNLHHHADVLEAHLAGRKHPRIILSDERDGLLDSGGGIRKALPHLGELPFFVMNADTIWIEGMRPNLRGLAQAFDGDRMDGLLLLAASTTSVGYDGRGDFLLDPEGRLARRPERGVAPFVYAGAAVLHPRLFRDAPEGAFSLNRLFNTAIGDGRLFGLRLEGLWMHVGTPEAIAEAETCYATSAA
ncbi:nucleotidyltransferase family protein [Terrihabitans rhizophilus]|uniref:Nucleotidyltransferase family protein n=1 Tax=Terrihabitans rhizophilus TaxID=3092662 RepID=A0ABU4RKA1_9HYPH|nr:nucleotidyltransferase family protein [Terrihabitans sp. PJ23]MDX6804613.1 nucleotidyltransferase family protein [Terrihabitans sp. PJ23]